MVTNPPPPPIKELSLYFRIVGRLDKFVPPRLLPLWHHAAGPKTVFFWCPFFKWGLVMAGIGDLTRPVETININQSAALAATGFIWTRYCFVITPRNYNLMSVNFFVGLTGLYQIGRALKYQAQVKRTQPVVQ